MLLGRLAFPASDGVGASVAGALIVVLVTRCDREGGRGPGKRRH